MKAPSPSAVTVTFWGAARTVTGSMHLLEIDGYRVLLDCGLYQGPRAEARERNTHFPFDPGKINAVVLSHAHIDHCGNLPNLVKQGFNGPIFCTPATRDLAAVMLVDSAKIQEEDAAYLNKKRKPGEPAVHPLYVRHDAYEAARRCHGVPCDQPHEIGHGIELRFVEAGHILGSAMVHLKVGVNGRARTITFTGDLGRRGLPILRDPDAVPAADLLISESTYGNKVHEPFEKLGERVAEVIRRTADRGGKILIPAFSLGRTQAILHFFHELLVAGQIPDLPIHIDSPLAANATEVFRLHPECFDDETDRLIQEDSNLFGGRRVRFVHAVEESKALNNIKDPCVIVAASGMCEAGRILHHLKNNIEDPRHTVMIVGFQAPDTLGRRLVERRPRVRIFGKEYQLRAEVATMNGFSSHADQNDFRDFLGPLARSCRFARLVHGEMEPAQTLAASLRSQGFKDVQIPDRGEAVVLT